MYKTYIEEIKSNEEVRRDDGSLVVVGDRVVSLDDHFAVVKYIGEVPPTNGLWLGVEWDEPERGKHDGKHNGVRYFQTKHENSGSFIRPQKVKTGVTFLTAVKDRYGLKDDHDAGVMTEELYVLGSNNQTTVVEMVGAKSLNLRQSKLEYLKEAHVKGSCVYGTGQDDDLKIILPNVREVNLGKNLLASWKRVAEIVRQLPKLTSLILSINRLPVPEDPRSYSSDFSRIQALVMNKTLYSWKEVLRCCEMLENVESIGFNNNQLKSLIDTTGYLNNLTYLALESNELTSWKDILHLGKLPKLETLSLNENQIDSIEFPDVSLTEKTSLFPQLHTLYINKNSISQWSSINELNKLQNLREIMMLFNPVNSIESVETTRQLFIAKISTLALLNRTEITPEERKGSEIDYLKRFGQKWKEAGGSQVESENKPNTEFLQEHPRYLELLKKWGAPEDSELNQKSSMLKDNLVCVKLLCEQSKTKGLIEKKLPQTMTVQKVRAMVKRLFKADPSSLQLSYSSQKMDGPSIEMDNDLRQLSFYSIESGDTINVKW